MIYLHEEGGQYVGPFKSRMHAERFVEMMTLCGEDWAGMEVVENEGGVSEAMPKTDLIQ
jgi:hypothetical protein